MSPICLYTYIKYCYLFVCYTSLAIALLICHNCFYRAMSSVWIGGHRNYYNYICKLESCMWQSGLLLGAAVQKKRWRRKSVLPEQHNKCILWPVEPRDTVLCPSRHQERPALQQCENRQCNLWVTLVDIWILLWSVRSANTIEGANIMAFFSMSFMSNLFTYVCTCSHSDCCCNSVNSKVNIVRVKIVLHQ